MSLLRDYDDVPLVGPSQSANSKAALQQLQAHVGLQDPYGRKRILYNLNRPKLTSQRYLLTIVHDFQLDDGTDVKPIPSSESRGLRNVKDNVYS
jgi:hypothetical protein